VFNPTDFLTIANRFQSSGSEAERRTAVGRSYYAVYNLFVESLSKEGVSFEKNGADHERLLYYLESSKIHEAEKAGLTLNNLRNSRNDADYAMGKSIDPRQSEFAFKRARSTIDEVRVEWIRKLASAISYLSPFVPRRDRQADARMSIPSIPLPSHLKLI